MNQDRIGKFIKEKREGLNLTQEELANKLHVTNKTISKWENGRGLMDITMLKPVSKVLNVSVLELINGQSDKSDISYDDALSITIGFMNGKLKKVRIKTIIYTILIPIILFLIIITSYKSYLLIRYNVKSNSKILNIQKNKSTEIVSQNNSVYDTSNMIRYGDVAFVNKFKDYELISPDNEVRYESYKFIKKDSSGNVVSMFWLSNKPIFSLVETLDTVTKEANVNSDDKEDYIVTKKDIRRFLVDKDINDDVDLIRYFKENYYFKSSILTSVSNIKLRYSLNKVADIFPAMHNSVTFVKGKNKGYIINFGKESSYNNLKLRELYLIVNGKVYVFDFVGDELTTDKYIKDFIDTTMIDQLRWIIPDSSQK